jgi:hypothetical protein
MTVKNIDMNKLDMLLSKLQEYGRIILNLKDKEITAVIFDSFTEKKYIANKDIVNEIKQNTINFLYKEIDSIKDEIKELLKKT